jgi:hypothetical protein
VKLLFDANLSPKLVGRLAELFPEFKRPNERAPCPGRPSGG